MSTSRAVGTRLVRRKPFASTGEPRSALSKCCLPYRFQSWPLARSGCSGPSLLCNLVAREVSGRGCHNPFGEVPRPPKPMSSRMLHTPSPRDFTAIFLRLSRPSCRRHRSGPAATGPSSRLKREVKTSTSPALSHRAAERRRGAKLISPSTRIWVRAADRSRWALVRGPS